VKYAAKALLAVVLAGLTSLVVGNALLFALVLADGNDDPENDAWMKGMSLLFQNVGKSAFTVFVLLALYAIAIRGLNIAQTKKMAVAAAIVLTLINCGFLWRWSWDWSNVPGLVFIFMLNAVVFGVAPVAVFWKLNPRAA
jgi:hypothetical protein